MDQWKRLGQPKEAWGNEWVKIVEFPVQLPTGVKTQFYAMDASDGVAVLAVDDKKCAVINSQYRPAIDRVILELPAGQVEKGEDLIQALKREMAEESGLVVNDIKYLGSFYRNPARDTGSMHIYFARVDHITRPHQEKFEYIETMHIPLDELLEKVIRNEIQDVTTCFAVTMLYLRLGRGEIQL